MFKIVRKGHKCIHKRDMVLIECCKSGTYSQFAALAATVDMSVNISSSLMLFRANGNQIFDEPINVRGRIGEEWILGDYIVK